MSDTRALLNRIASFRQRLEATPHLVPTVVEEHSSRDETAAALASRPDWLAKSLRTLAGDDGSAGNGPPQLTIRARQLLEDAGGLIAFQRNLGNDPLLAGLSMTAPGPDADPVVTYYRETVALTDAALRTVQAFPASAEVQVRMCDGVEAMLRAVRDRLAIAHRAVMLRKKDMDRIDGLARRLSDVVAMRAVDLSWFAKLAEQILDDARLDIPMRFLNADATATSGYPGGPEIAAPARFVAAQAITVAQVVARVAPHDYEWAGRALLAVTAALLMDVGALRVPPEVFSEAGPMTPGDRRQIDAHPEAGADIIRNQFPDAGVIATAVAAHHERPDGTGYPNALTGDAIPSLARLLSVCDYYAALMADRPHRPGKDPRTALTETLTAAEQGRLDRDMAEYLLHLSFHPIGTVVELTDGRIGVVVANHTSRVNLRATARPVVAVVTDPAGLVLPRPDFVDLAAAQRGGVVRVVPVAERRARLARYYPDLCA